MNISSKSYPFPIAVLPEKSSGMLERLKKINSSFWLDKALEKDLESLDSVELTNVLNTFFMETLQENSIVDPVKFFDRFATVISLKTLQKAVKENVPDAQEAFEEVKSMFEEAKYYLDATDIKVSSSIRARISSIIDGIIQMIEVIITGFGIGDFFKPSESDMEAEYKSQKIFILLGLFSTITTMIATLCSPLVGGLIVGGIIITIIALSIIWPMIKPIPTHLPGNAENWTKQIRNGHFVAQGREESLRKIKDIIKEDQHAILVGPSRVGKSLTAKAFANAIERGAYPDLKGKVVFRINTADILGHQASFFGGGNNILNKISTAMGRHRDNIILVLDEIHMACKNDEKIAEQLKTFLDKNGEFPHVIGITTEEEYEKHVKSNQAFSLRFKKVKIKNTSEDETLNILRKTLLRDSKAIIKSDTIEYIYQRSCEIKDAPQPMTSLDCLNQCINKVQQTQLLTETDKEIIEMTNKISSLRSRALISYGRKETKAEKESRKKEISDLEDKINELKTDSIKEQKKKNTLFEAQELLHKVVKESYISCIKVISKIDKEHPQFEKELKLFSLFRNFLVPALEFYIENTSDELSVDVIIDNEFVDKVAGPLQPAILQEAWH